MGHFTTLNYIMDLFCKVYMPSIFVNAFFLSKQIEHTNLITFCLQLANT